MKTFYTIAALLYVFGAGLMAGWLGRHIYTEELALRSVCPVQPAAPDSITVLKWVRTDSTWVQRDVKIPVYRRRLK